MKRLPDYFFVLCLLFNVATAGSYFPDPTRFEAAIKRFEGQDRGQQPSKGAILGAGSSSMRLWEPTIHQDFAPLTIINRGFGGSNYNDLLHYFDRIIKPYRPRAIIIYEGDNDVALGVPNEVIVHTAKLLLERISNELPDTRVYILAVKPSLSRMQFWPAMDELNNKMRKICEGHPQWFFVDVATPMFAGEDKPSEKLYVEDRLHLSPEGYQIWARALRPILMTNELKYESQQDSHGRE